MSDKKKSSRYPDKPREKSLRLKEKKEKASRATVKCPLARSQSLSTDPPPQKDERASTTAEQGATALVQQTNDSAGSGDSPDVHQTSSLRKFGSAEDLRTYQASSLRKFGSAEDLQTDRYKVQQPIVQQAQPVQPPAAAQPPPQVPQLIAQPIQPLPIMAGQPQIKFQTPPTFRGAPHEDAVEWLNRYETTGRYNR